jgi:hypothetical protein
MQNTSEPVGRTWRESDVILTLFNADGSILLELTLAEIRVLKQLVARLTGPEMDELARDVKKLVAKETA